MAKRPSSAAHDERPAKRSRSSAADRLSQLSDELLLRVLSYLTVTELNLCQRVSRKYKSIATDSQLWKAHYYNRFVRPRALRIPGIRFDNPAATSSRLHFSSKTSKWLEEENLVRKGTETNWKLQYRLRHNWSRGACRLSEIEVAKSPPVPPLLVRLHDGVVYTADTTSGLRAWNVKGKRRLLAETRFGPKFAPPTSLALDTYTAKGTHYPQIVIGFEDGAFQIYQLSSKSGHFNRLYTHVASSNGTVAAVAFSFPYLLTMTDGQLLSIYKFPGSTSSNGLALLEHPQLLRSMRSYTVSQPISLSVRPASSGLMASVAYAVPALFTSGWSVGLQEMQLTTEGELVDARIATASTRKFSLPIFHKPTSLSYSHPYLLVSHEDNTLTLYVVTSNKDTLSISAGKRLWGHTSAISAAHIGGRGKAVSVSQRGGEMRIWELEGTLKTSKSQKVGSCVSLSVLVRPGEDDNSNDSFEQQSAFGVAGIAEAMRKRGDGLEVALMNGADDITVDNELVGFDEENVVVLSQKEGGSQALVLYDFT